MEKILSLYFSIPQKVLKATLYFILIIMAGITYLSLFLIPPDEVQGEPQRIMYIHVPSALTAEFCMFIVGISSLLYFITRKEGFDFIAWGFAKVGSVFALSTLLTGSIWGRTIWGVWWTWDARLTSMLIFFMIYLAYLILGADKITRIKTIKGRAILGIVGTAEIPIIKFSVYIWRTLHQGSTLMKKTIAPEFLKLLIASMITTLTFAIITGIIFSLKEKEKREKEL